MSEAWERNKNLLSQLETYLLTQLVYWFVLFSILFTDLLKSQNLIDGRSISTEIILLLSDYFVCIWVDPGQLCVGQHFFTSR